MTHLRKSQTYHLRTQLLFNFGNNFRLGQVANLWSNCERMKQRKSNTNYHTCDAQTRAIEHAITQSRTNLDERGKMRKKNWKPLPIWSCDSPMRICKEKSKGIGSKLGLGEGKTKELLLRFREANTRLLTEIERWSNGDFVSSWGQEKRMNRSHKQNEKLFEKLKKVVLWKRERKI